MVKKELLNKLKNSKVKKDRKWIYNLITWALENQDKDIVTFQRKITTTIHYTKGKYQDYWDNPRVKAQHDLSDKRCKEKNKKHIEASKKYNTELKIAYLLFKTGSLSKQSTKEIEKMIEDQKQKY